MLRDAPGLLLFVAALLHLFFFIYNRYLLCIKDGPWKRPIHQLWFVVSVVLPTVAVLLAWEVPAVAQAIHWSPTSPAGVALFIPVAGLEAFLTARVVLWVMARVAPDRPGGLLSRSEEPLDVPPVAPLLPPILRPWESTGDLVLTRYEVAVSGLAPAFDGLTVVQVSDIHYGQRLEMENYFEGVRQRVAELGADIVVLTGDFVDRRRDIRRAVEYHAGFAGRLATLAVLGNHDYWTDPDRIRRELGRTHIAWLGGGERRVLKRGGRRLIFTGTDLPWNNQASADWRRLIRRETGDAVVLLSHTPDNAPEAARAGASLVLAGHNHGGQYCLPLVGPIVMPSLHGLAYAGGIYRAGPETALVVSRGVGVSGRGARTLCKPEVCLLTLRAPAVDVMVGEESLVRGREAIIAQPVEEKIPQGGALGQT